MALREEQIGAILERLSNALGQDMGGAVVTNNSGIILAARMASDVNANRVGAVAATMISITRRVNNELRIGSTTEGIIKASHGFFLVVPAGDEVLLAVSLHANANLGLVRLEVSDASQQIRQAFD